MISFTQSLAPQQRQVIAPQLQHAVKLLQMSSLDFAAAVRGLLGSNPFLEAVETADAPENAHRSGDADPDATHDSDRDLWLGDGRGGMRRAEDGELDALALTAAPQGLHEHLQAQLGPLRLGERDRLLAALIAGSLDEDGYLRDSLDELASAAGLQPAASPEELQIALRRVQSLDPAGVGARDLAECLLLQLPAIEDPRLRALARSGVADHLPLLAGREMRRLAAALGVPPAEAEAVRKALRRLDPRPGRRFDTSRTDCIVPDVVAFRGRGGGWQVKLNAAVVPRVRINEVYAELFRRHRERERHAELEQQLGEAQWMLRNIERRFATILDVAGAIVRRQERCLDYGVMAMQPLMLKEIADETGVHESTVSRVCSGKYIATPRGVHELKYFFSRAMPEGPSHCSATAIRGLVQRMIDAEPRQTPLSDAEIARRLARQGLAVARRTVTKYRQMLRIETAELRRMAVA